jgi:hypothetical protein
MATRLGGLMRFLGRGWRESTLTPFRKFFDRSLLGEHLGVADCG